MGSTCLRALPEDFSNAVVASIHLIDGRENIFALEVQLLAESMTT